MTQWWQNQIEILPTGTITAQSEPGQNQEIEEQPKASCLALVLPRFCYFETYKTYPLSVGKDIYKIAKVDGRQVSPYHVHGTNNQWFAPLILKNEDHYLVYYFVLLPKYQAALDQRLPLFVVPETASALARLNKAKSNEPEVGFQKDKDGVWSSNVSYRSDAPASIGLEQANFAFIQAFFNPQVFTQLATKFNRWQQLKWITAGALVASLYLGTATLYFTGVEVFLNEKRAAVGPIISEVFKVRSDLQTLNEQQDALSDVFRDATEKTGPLTLLENQYEKYNLNVKSIDLRGKTVRVQATANDANSLLESLLASEFVKDAEFKSEVKKINQDTEQFELEFVWEQKLWR